MDTPETFQLESARGTRIAGRREGPAQAPRADVLLVHGLAEHLGRYEHVIAALARAGYRVTAFELRGHGASEGRRGHVRRWSDYVADLRAAEATIAGDYALFAHSTGCLVALDHLREATRARAAVLTGPLLGVPHTSKRLFSLVHVLSALVPALRLKGEFDPADVCSDPAVVEAYRRDPLVFEGVTARWVTEMLRATRRVQRHAPRYRVPLAVHWGTADRIVSVADIERFCAAYGGPIECKGWPGLYHEILNEPCKEQVLGELLEWTGANATPR